MSNDDPFPDAATVARPAVEPARALSYRFVLTVVEGADRGRSFAVEGSQPSAVLVGTSDACDGRLSDPSVSRRHLALDVLGHQLRVRDLGSTNGTVVDGLKVLEAYLEGGETLRVGGTALQIDRGEETSVLDPPRANRFGRLLGASHAMRRLYPLCDRLAQSDVPLVLEGETGTGKEQLAEALHEQGPRASGPFVVFDCTAVAPSLIESELFGHEKGAFTGSVTAHQGVFERAHGGTLLVDEVGDMPLGLQPKLLRAIERLQITRVGGQGPIQVDVRVIAATRRDLDRMVQLGRFRDDLFHRLAVARVALPALRERHGDVVLLARHFCAEFGGEPDTLPGDLLRSWEDDPWPGNVRELRNAVARRVALGDLTELAGGAATASSGGAALHAVGSGGDAIAAVLALDLPLADARQRVVDEFEQRYVDRMLDLHDGNVTRAAAAAGVARRHFQRIKAKDRSRG